ncbi:unnamed protein product [Protopolystoma xenopodis]|uniref:Major facilitator superfamily (MFS) profile domain-containing protein n=1 Tax=Protopolystoma xenopodis TaxID=117903 RepID=A0A3S4ZLW3_9PLAT|nr:unnamed protein product [Protopolystoma xenopodis]
MAVAGYAVNVIDLAPNFAGLVMGFANSVSTLTGKFLILYTINKLINQQRPRGVVFLVLVN